MKFISVASALTLCSCVAISEGTIETSQKILITSTPKNAKVSQSSRTICYTPCRAQRRNLKFGEGFKFTFENGQTIDVEAKYENNAAAAGNIIAGGFIGLAFDAATGRIQVRPDHIHVDLETDDPN